MEARVDEFMRWRATRVDTRLLGWSLRAWQMKTKAAALVLTLQAFDRHLGLRCRPKALMLTHGMCVRALRRWHYAARLASLADVRRARLSLAFAWFRRVARARALHVWRAATAARHAAGGGEPLWRRSGVS